MYGRINTVANNEPMEFNKYTAKAIEEMQRDGFEVEVQFSTNIENDGRLLYVALILGKVRDIK